MIARATLDEFVEDLGEEASTIKERILQVIGSYGHRCDRIHENYTLVALLFLRDYCLEDGEGLEELLTKASRWETPSTTSIHRMMTEVKKMLDSPQQAEEAMRRKEAWRQVMRRERE